VTAKKARGRRYESPPPTLYSPESNAEAPVNVTDRASAPRHREPRASDLRIARTRVTHEARLALPIDKHDSSGATFTPDLMSLKALDRHLANALFQASPRPELSSLGRPLAPEGDGIGAS
jgi:hypothetical protein